jgi:predicted RNA-binding Zn-ribbon protein involved in translation (DUF1610 family)
MHRIFRLACLPVACLALLFAVVCAAQEQSERDDRSVKMPCPECGVIYSIREVKRERGSARNVPENPAPVGPMIRFSLGDKADRGPHFDVVGSAAMREAMMETYYIVVVRFDDNRWQRIELPDATGLKVGARIHVHQNLIEPDDRYLP